MHWWHSMYRMTFLITVHNGQKSTKLAKGEGTSNVRRIVGCNRPVLDSHPEPDLLQRDPKKKDPKKGPKKAQQKKPTTSVVQVTSVKKVRTNHESEDHCTALT